MAKQEKVVTHKVCSKCKRNKHLDDFNKNSKGKHGRHHYCRKCHRASVVYKYRYHSTKWAQIANKYGLTKDSFDSLLHKQGGKCAICYHLFDPHISSSMHIDHCHKSGKIRGILCRGCNHLLGNAKDDIVILQGAINYLCRNKDT